MQIEQKHSRHMIFDRLYDRSNFVSDQTRLVMTGQTGPDIFPVTVLNSFSRYVRPPTWWSWVPAKTVRVRAAMATPHGHDGTEATVRPRPKPLGSTVRPSSSSS